MTRDMAAPMISIPARMQPSRPIPHRQQAREMTGSWSWMEP